MIVLSLTTDKLQVVLGEAISTTQPQCVSSWRDITSQSYVPDRTVTNTNGTTDVDAVGAPAVGVQRVIDLVSVYNADTIAHIITIKYDAAGTEYILWKGSVPFGFTVQWTEGAGIVVTSPTTVSGYPKQLGYMGY